MARLDESFMQGVLDAPQLC